MNEDMFKEFKSLGKQALSMDHYQLNVVCPTYSPEEWKEFLQTPEITDFVKTEMLIIREKELNRLIQESGNSRSVGQSQMISALSRLEEDEPETTGPIFIFCHVPLNEEQEKAPNVEHDLSAFGFKTISKG